MGGSHARGARWVVMTRGRNRDRRARPGIIMVETEGPVRAACGCNLRGILAALSPFRGTVRLAVFTGRGAAR
jgi:hypothetical protein